MFKVFLFSATILGFSVQAFAQDSAPQSSEVLLSNYLNASAVCAKMTDPEQLYNRAMLLMQDKSDESYLAASECLTSAAMRNHTGAQLELGKLYESGQGVSASNVFAYKWLQTAVLLGNKEAIPYRDQLESKMDLDDIAMANPMIQSTLKLIDLYEQHRAKEITEYEKTVADEYRKFGVDVSKFDEQKKKKDRKSDNLLIEALIRDQEALDQKAKQKGKGSDIAPAPQPNVEPVAEEESSVPSRRKRRSRKTED